MLPNVESTNTNESGIQAETVFNENDNITTTIPIGTEEPVATFDQYLMSIVFMPHSLRMVCLTNLFCWMAHVCPEVLHFIIFHEFIMHQIFQIPKLITLKSDI